MKRKIYIFLILILCLTITIFTNTNINVLANTDAQNFEVKVIGEGIYYASPDKATIYAKIETYDIQESYAKEKIKADFNNLKSILETYGISPNNISASYNNTYPIKDNCYYDTTVYFSNISFQIEINNLDILESVCEFLDNQENVNINSINYSLKNSNPSYLNALKLAIQDANEKVSSLYSGYNIVLLEIEEEENYYCSTLYKEYITEEISKDINQSLEIRAKIKATFSIE